MKNLVSKWFVLPFVVGGLLTPAMAQGTVSTSAVDKTAIVAPAKADALAKSMPTMALVPQGSAAVLAVFDLAGMWEGLLNTPLGQLILQENGMDFGKCATQVPVGDVVIALGDVWTQIVQQNKEVAEPLGSAAAPLLELVSVLQSPLTLTMMGSNGPSLEEQMKANVKHLLPALAKVQWDKVKETTPIMTVIASTKDKNLQQQVMAQISEGLAKVEKSSKGVLAPYSVEQNGMKLSGVKVDMPKLIAELNEQMRGNPDVKELIATAEVLDMTARLAKTSLYVLTAQVDNKVVLFVCSDPANAKLAKTANVSVLADPTFADNNWRASDKPIGLFGLTKQAAKAYNDVSLSFYSGWNKASAASSVNKEFITKLIAYASSVQITRGITGFAEMGPKGVVASLLGDDAKIVDSGPWVIPNLDLDQKGLLVMSAKWTKEFTDYMKAYYGAQITNALNMLLRDEDPAMKMKTKAIVDGIMKGLGNQGSLMIDLEGTVPNISDAAEELKNLDSFVRIICVQSVADRKALASVWDVASTLPSFEEDIPPVSWTEKNGSITYTMETPINTPAFAPSIVINDKLIFATTDSFFAHEVVQAPVSNEVAGMRGVFRLGVLKNYVAKLIDQVPASKNDMEVVQKYLDAANQTIGTIEFKVIVKDGVQTTTLECK